MSLLCTFNNGVQHIKFVLRDGTSGVLVRAVGAGEYRYGCLLLYNLLMLMRQLPPKGVRCWRHAADRFTRAAQLAGLLRAVVARGLRLFGPSWAST